MTGCLLKKKECTQEKCHSCDYIVLLGDLNARLGDLNKVVNCSGGITYTLNPDTTVNTHGKEIISLCNGYNLLPVNHLKIGNLVCDGNFTFRQKKNWISHIDWCLCSGKLIRNVEAFNVESNIVFPSNHAPISLSIKCDTPNPDMLLDRAKLLLSEPERKLNKCSNPIRLWKINIDRFKRVVPDPMSLLVDNTDDLCDRVTEALYSACDSAVETKRSINFKIL